MKKIALFLVICILLCSTDYSVFADEHNFVTVDVVDGAKDKTWCSVIKRDNDLLFSGEDLVRLSGFEYKIQDGIVNFTRGDKEIKIVIKDNSYTLGENFSVHIFENPIVNMDGKYYFSGAELLPWLNVTCFIEDGKFHIVKDACSFWEIGRSFMDEKEDVLFDFEQCCKQLGENSKWLMASSYVMEECLSGIFADVIWVPFSSHSLGDQQDYAVIFETMLQDQNRVMLACEDILEDAEAVSATLSVIDSITSEKNLPDEFKATKKRLEHLTKYGDDVLEGVTYLMLLDDDITEQLMWLNAMTSNRGNYNYPEAMIAAAMQVDSVHQNTSKAYFDKAVYSLTDDVIEKFIDVVAEKGLVEAAVSVFGLISAIKPVWSEGINNIADYNSLAQCGIDVYVKEFGGTHIHLIERQRAHAMFYLYAMEQNWSTMAELASNRGKTDLAEMYKEIADKAAEWQSKFLQSKGATVNDSHEYGDGYGKEEYEGKLREMFAQLIFKEDIMEEDNTEIEQEDTRVEDNKETEKEEVVEQQKYDENELKVLYKDFFYANYSDSDLVCLKDVTRDGNIDMIVVHAVSEQEYVGTVYTMKDDAIEMIYEKKGATVHAGGFFNWYLLENENGWNLAEEVFGMWQGRGHTDFLQYYLTNDGEVREVDKITVPATEDELDENGYVKDEAFEAYKNKLNKKIRDAYRIFYSYSEADAKPRVIETNPAVVFGDFKDTEKEESEDIPSDNRVEDYVDAHRDYISDWILYSASYYMSSFGNIDPNSENVVYDITAILQIIYLLDGGTWNIQNEIPVSEVERLLACYTKTDEYSIDTIKKVIEGYEYIWYDETIDAIVFGGLFSDLQGNPDWSYECLESGELKVTVKWIDAGSVIFSQELIFTTELLPRLISYSVTR